MTKFQDVTCVLLAAGASTRFGSDKLLHHLPGGKSLLASSLELYSQVFSKIAVVINPANLDFDKQRLIIISQGANYISSPMADLGLSQSLVAGICATTPSTGWLIALADMPYLKLDTIRQLAAALEHDNIVLPVSSKGPGNPVGFGVGFKAQLIKLEGDKGAKAVLESNSQAVVQVQLDDLGIHHDIDRLGDIKTL